VKRVEILEREVSELRSQIVGYQDALRVVVHGKVIPNEDGREHIERIAEECEQAARSLRSALESLDKGAKR
jgi:chromosome condensin MukBEF ATPase and DNA-binding subunit MukB